LVFSLIILLLISNVFKWKSEKVKLKAIILLLFRIFQIILKKIHQTAEKGREKWKQTDKVQPVVEEQQANEEFSKNKMDPSYVNGLRQRCVRAYLTAEKNRAACDDTIKNEYETKTLLFGYIMVIDYYYLFVNNQ
jgi:hypothetical protein